MTIFLSSNIDNASLQIGDTAYYLETTSLSDLNQQQVGGNPIQLGRIDQIGSDFIVVDTNTAPPIDAFIMFLKNNVVNNGRLKGYYAEVEMVHTGPQPAELYAVSSEVTGSSK